MSPWPPKAAILQIGTVSDRPDGTIQVAGWQFESTVQTPVTVGPNPAPCTLWGYTLDELRTLASSCPDQ